MDLQLGAVTHCPITWGISSICQPVHPERVWWESANGWQELVTDLPKGESFSPDAAFFTGTLPANLGKFLEGAPILAVEVRSENDYGETAEKEIAKKRVNYFEAGTLVVWDVDVLRRELIKVFRASDPLHPTVYRR